MTREEVRRFGDAMVEAYNRTESPEKRITTFDAYLEENGLYYAFVFHRPGGERMLMRWTPAEIEAAFRGDSAPGKIQ
jgi:hypothetical protein